MKRIIFALAFCLLFLSGNSFGAVSVIGELTRKYVVKPGGNYEGTVTLRNKGDKPQEVKIDKRDYLFYKDGQNIFGEPSSHPRSNAQWISVSPSRLTVPPGETINVNFKIHVPEDSTLRGSYWSILMVEPVEPISPETLVKSEDKKITMSLRIVIKHAIQIITDLGDTGTTKIKFIDKKVVEKNGRRFLEIDIENTGERWVDPQLWVELFDQEGKAVGKFQGNKVRILPGCSSRFYVDINEIPKGKYKALLVADSSAEKVFGTRLNLKIE
ncbi:MAG: hypothetical protein AB1502_13290 [Thermodesulfobacteriota bacterium]